MKPIDFVAITGSVGVLAAVIALVVTGRLKPRYALLWLVCAAALVAASVFRKVLIDDVGAAFGIAYPPALLFLTADVFLMLILLHMCVVVSRLTDRTQRLAQDIALLRGELESAGRPK